MGHLMRCAEILGEAHARGWRVGLALDGDEAARDVLDRTLPGLVPSPWSSPASVAGRARWTLFDTRSPCAPSIAAVAEAGGRTVVLDRTDVVDEATFTVLPILHAEPLDHPRVRTGGPWCIVSETVRAGGRAEPEAERDALLVTFGGADPLGLTAPWSHAVADVLDGWRGGPPPTLHVVIGPAFEAPERVAEAIRPLGAVIHHGPTHAELAALMRRSHGALVGFGTAVYELAWLGVPMVYVTHHADDRPHAGRLADLGVGGSGGFGSDLDAAAFGARLGTTLFDPDWRAATSASGQRQLGDGHGSARLLDLLESKSDDEESA